MCFATCVVSTLLKRTERPFLILLKEFTLGTLVFDLVIKTKFGLQILCVRLLQNPYGNRVMEKERA